LNTENFIDNMFEFTDRDFTSYNDFFNNMGLNSLNILINIGSIIIMFIAITFLTLVVYCINKLKFNTKKL
jgi:hypothetical protein